MPIQLEGFDSLKNKLEDVEENTQEVSGTKEVDFNELFSPEFMSANTDFESFEELLERSKWNVYSAEDFEKIPRREFDRFVASTTSFDSWEEMLSVATNEWIAKKIGLEF